jgi:hypothetical protein
MDRRERGGTMSEDSKTLDMSTTMPSSSPLLFDDFLIIGIDRTSHAPVVRYRLSQDALRSPPACRRTTGSLVAALRDEEIVQFTFPYGVPAVGTLHRSEDFTFTLSKVNCTYLTTLNDCTCSLNSRTLTRTHSHTLLLTLSVVRSRRARARRRRR